jgi:hypothetical protein
LPETSYWDRKQLGLSSNSFSKPLSRYNFSNQPPSTTTSTTSVLWMSLESLNAAPRPLYSSSVSTYFPFSFPPSFGPHSGVVLLASLFAFGTHPKVTREGPTSSHGTC